MDVEENRSCRAVGMRQQGAWTRWKNTLERNLTWTEIWRAEPHRIKVPIQAVYDVLPSPSNLHAWGLRESPACPLCSKRDTLENVLSCCTTALGEGHYRWRHDQILKTIAEAINTGLVWAKQLGLPLEHHGLCECRRAGFPSKESTSVHPDLSRRLAAASGP